MERVEVRVWMVLKRYVENFYNSRNKSIDKFKKASRGNWRK